jgi:glycerol-3-phosphate dehydrogenase
VTNLEDSAFDAVVIGGGVYGILLALEGASRGQRVLLIERDDFGGGASFNHLRTIHGGLRYLQSLDLRRAITSNHQRLWWLRNFPDLVHPISCLMPLYNRGLRRPAAFRAAFLIARLLGLHKDGEGRSGRFEVISSNEVRALFPYCCTDGLDRGALWQDALMESPHRVIAELLHWAESAGAIVRNRTELLAATAGPNGAWRLGVRNRRTDQNAEVAARWIINATASAADDVVRKIVARPKGDILVPTIGWGLLLDRAPVSECSVAVTAPGKGGRTYFVHPYHGRILAGTGHAGVTDGTELKSGVPEPRLRETLADLNEAMPGIALTRDEVSHVFHGVLPGLRWGSDALLSRPRIIDHGERDGAPGAFTVLGVKFTEAPFVARKLWTRLLGSRPAEMPRRPSPISVPSIRQARAMSDEQLATVLRGIAEVEWQASASDLAWRRTDLWMDRIQARRVADLACPAGARGSVSESVPWDERLD